MVLWRRSRIVDEVERHYQANWGGPVVWQERAAEVVLVVNLKEFFPQIESDLAAVPPRQQIAFATACAERMAPGFIAQSGHRPGDRAFLRDAIDALWRMAGGDDRSVVTGLIERLNEFPELHGEEEHQDVRFYATNAVIQVMLALRVVDQQPGAVISVPGTATETADAFDVDLEAGGAYLEWEIDHELRDMSVLRLNTELSDGVLADIRERSVRARVIVEEAMRRLRAR